MRPAYSPALALRATGLLAQFNAAGVLQAADVHVASRLGALVGEPDEQVLLAAALTVRATRLASVVTDLADVATTAAPEDAALTGTVRPGAGSDGAGGHGAGSDGAGGDGAGGDGAGGDGEDAIADLPWPEPEAWAEACGRSPLTVGPDAPLRQRGSRLWLARYDAQEQQVVDELRSRAADLPITRAGTTAGTGGADPVPADGLDLDVLRAGLDRLFGDPADADQRLAAAVCALSRVSVLAGGPGTGKTTTVSRVLALLKEQHPGWRVALAAPTGKAAARLDEAVAGSTQHFSDPADVERVAGLRGVTLHRLLGWRPGSRSRFRHDRNDRLPYEVVVVDEASMVPLTLMARLLEALRPTTRLVLVGDPDQLASVEAGAVLGDLVDRAGIGHRTGRMRALLDTVVPEHGSRPAEDSPAARVRDGIAVLTTTHRFAAGGAIAALAAAVRAGDVAGALAVLRDEADDAVELVEVADDAPLTPQLLAPVEADVVAWGRSLRAAALAGDAPGALAALDAHRLLCAHRRGPRGVQAWEATALRWLAAADPDHARVRADGHHAGEPLLVTSNDYEVQLFNGDTGVVVAEPGSGPTGVRPGVEPRLTAWFHRGGSPVEVPLVRLGAVRPVHAMTVHRSQGSQFDRVTVVLPTADSPLATRETLYTALTRAVRHVRVVGSTEAFAAAVERPAARATGLRERLTG